MTDQTNLSEPDDREIGVQPLVMRLTVDVTFDHVIGQSATSSDRDERAWFNELINGPELFIHSNEVGCTIGELRVVSIDNVEAIPSA